MTMRTDYCKMYQDGSQQDLSNIVEQIHTLFSPQSVKAPVDGGRAQGK